MVRENLNIFFGLIYFYPTFALAKTKEDSVAQLVEHIPFKDGVLGSSPSWITKNVGTCHGMSLLFISLLIN